MKVNVFFGEKSPKGNTIHELVKSLLKIQGVICVFLPKVIAPSDNITTMQQTLNLKSPIFFT